MRRWLAGSLPGIVSRIRPAGSSSQPGVNLATYSGILDRIRYELRFRTRGIGSNPNITAFGSGNVDAIQRIYVINLDRDPARWHQVSRELTRFHVSATASLSSITRRFPAVDARYLAGPPRNQDVVPTYSLADQWFASRSYLRRSRHHRGVGPRPRDSRTGPPTRRSRHRVPEGAGACSSRSARADPGIAPRVPLSELVRFVKPKLRFVKPKLRYGPRA